MLLVVLVSGGAFAVWEFVAAPALKRWENDRRIAEATPAVKSPFRDCFVRVNFDFVNERYRKAYEGEKIGYDAAQIFGEAVPRSDVSIAGLVNSQEIPGSLFIGFTKDCDERFTVTRRILRDVRETKPEWVTFEVSEKLDFPDWITIDPDNPFWLVD